MPKAAMINACSASFNEDLFYRSSRGCIPFKHVCGFAAEKAVML
ncbi:hypothetical protein MAXJ12_12972 [Mesorhizobium alhagi CCNWXJ12-2]|uniref:Uncharacterized protein n=1 Tax=Mesorhizobium alhagi CCNWXJ12-2 TaxID=1107882 RepID=H0HR12_9HYPH|nr:hypothetical protein MAXJ12_12972 [Mesorhizobium alhagi CCNWXJ12-2]